MKFFTIFFGVLIVGGLVAWITIEVIKLVKLIKSKRATDNKKSK